MRRYCEIPVEKMTNADKIKAMTHRMNIMGGTYVWPKFGEFTFAFENVGVGAGDSMYLYEVGMTKLIFCEMDKERMKKEGTDKPLPNYGKQWEMPIDWFSESFLYSVLMTLKYACKRSLTSQAYAEVINEIGETPETDRVDLDWWDRTK